MPSNIIKQINVKATFPNGRIVTGVTNTIEGNKCDDIFQVWPRKGGVDSILINPKHAETIEFNIDYEK